MVGWTAYSPSRFSIGFFGKGDNGMTKITWCPCEVPPFLPVTQVYGIVFDTQGRILLKVEEKGGKQIFGLPGGTPEDFDADRIATLSLISQTK